MAKTTVSVAQIMHFKKASDALTRYISEQLEKTKTAEDRAPFQSLVSAAQTVDNMAHTLLSAEVNVRG